jgi:flagellar M-ring protein FliF
MKIIDQLARAAIGIDTQRGDVLAVENLSFQELPSEAVPPPSRTEHWRRLLEPWSWILRYVGLGALFLVIYWLVLRPVKKQALAAFRELPARASSRAMPAGATASGALGAGEAAGVVPPEGKRAGELKRQLAEKVKAEPASASRLVQGWMQEGQS